MVDQNARALVASMPVPEFDDPAFVTPKPLTDATVAIVTTAGLMHPGEPWLPGETAYRFFSREDGDLIVGHVSMNFDRSGVAADRNVVYPIDRLDELAAAGEIGRAAERHISFMGGLPDLTGVIVDSGPEAAAALIADGVDIVILTPACPVCPRTVATLAHVLEKAGLATVAFMSNLDFAERVRPPRALFCNFPIGRPLGKPGDAEFQRDVLRAGFELLSEPEGPVLRTHPDVIEDEGSEALACTLPPSFDDSVAPAVAEARALRPAYERARSRASGQTSVGRVVPPEEIDAAVGRFADVADGVPWSSSFESEARLLLECMDVRSYYEEAALGLVDHVPAARSSETWFYQSTAMGKLMERVIEALRLGEDEFASDSLMGLVPMSQPNFLAQLRDELVKAAARRGVANTEVLEG